MQHELKDT